MDKLPVYILTLGILIKFSFLVFFPNLVSFLDSSVEFSTPLTSWRSLEEGIFLLRTGISIYDGGVVYHPPIVLRIFALLQVILGENTELWRVGSAMVFQLADLVSTLQLLKLSDKFLAIHKNKSKQRFITILTVFYVFSPTQFLSTLSCSTTTFSNLFLTNVLYSVIMWESLPLAGIFLALSAYINYNSIFLLIPFTGMILNFDKFEGITDKPVKSRSALNAILSGLMPFVGTALVLINISFLENDLDPNWMKAAYGTNIFFTKINPNMGLWWYFFIEIFEFFSKFFIGMFNIYSVIYVLPLTLRFQKCKFSNLYVNNKYRFFPMVLCYGFIVLTKPYPTLNDLGFVINLLILLVFQDNFRIAKFLRYPIVSVLLIAHAIILSPIFYYLWIFSGSGNSNFFYAINLVYSLGLGSTLIDFIWSYLSLEYLFEKNNGKEVLYGSVRLTQI